MSDVASSVTRNPRRGFFGYKKHAERAGITLSLGADFGEIGLLSSDLLIRQTCLNAFVERHAIGLRIKPNSLHGIV